MKRNLSTILLGVWLFSLFSWTPALHAASENDTASASADQTQTSADTRTNESEKADKHGVPPDWVARAARERALGWPRSIQNDEGTFTIYQPQIKQWDYNVIEYGMA
ncbi:MAG: hypothetical protein JRF69_09225, partial [Deltaproteobacteria bacterium]|nr:hypothetical protein [Deltaproteobacteria bacterium]